jgi:D-threonate/D-erythronate kinase
MPGRWLIVADDLTGAADAGVAFARRGSKTKVLLPRASSVDRETAVVACDADTRRGNAEEAAARHTQVMRRFAGPDTHVYKKIDSTLRGHPAMEIAAMRRVLAEHQRPTGAVFAPAFPAMGRTTRDGRVFVHGKPLEQDETWTRERTFPSADLVEILASAGMSAIKVPLQNVRAGAGALRDELRAVIRERGRDGLGRIAICDAETDEDLDRIAAAAHTPESPAFLIGTAGLAHAVARAEPAGSRPARGLKPSNAGALIVVGSLASVSRAAARALESMAGVKTVRIQSTALREAVTSDALRAECSAAIGALESGTDVLVEIAEDVAPDLTRGQKFARALARGLADALDRFSGLIVTGGETAAALLAQQFVAEIELAGEVEPGVVLGVAHGHWEFPLVTKPGAFGDAGSLVRALEKLRMIRRTGTVA